MTSLPRRPDYECNHRDTVCRDCGGSPLPSTPWRIFVDRTPTDSPTSATADAGAAGPTA